MATTVDQGFNISHKVCSTWPHIQGARVDPQASDLLGAKKIYFRLQVLFRPDLLLCETAHKIKATADHFDTFTCWILNTAF